MQGAGSVHAAPCLLEPAQQTGIRKTTRLIWVGIPSGTHARLPRQCILTIRVCSRRTLGTPSSSQVARLRCSRERRALPSPSQAGRNRGWSYACENIGEHRIGLPAPGQHACPTEESDKGGNTNPAIGAPCLEIHCSRPSP